MFDLNPMTEEEALVSGLLPKGEYAFTVVNCESGTSRKGQPHLCVTLKVFDNAGEYKMVTDYLSVHYMQFKLRHFIVSLFGEEFYNQNKFTPEQAFDKTGRVKLFVQEGKDGFPPKNAVADYYVTDHTKSIVEVKTEEFKDDDLPF